MGLRKKTVGNLLTVVSITYNHEKFIRQTLESFLNQKTEQPFKIIISDDCSTDNTANIIREYAEKYPEIIIPVFREKNLGAIKNFVETLSLVDSEYVIYCEGDDYFSDPDKLQIQLNFLESNPECALCFHSVNVIYDDGSIPDEIFPPSSLRFDKTTLELNDLLKHNFMQTNSVMYRWRFRDKEQIKKIFPADVLPGDWYLHLLHAQTGKIGFIDKIMAVYRRHSGGIWWGATESIGEHDLKYGIERLRFHIHVAKNFKSDTTYSDLFIKRRLIDLILLFLKYKKFDKVEELAENCPYEYQQAMSELIRISVEPKKDQNFDKKVWGIPLLSVRYKHGNKKTKVLGITIKKEKNVSGEGYNRE